MLDNVLVVSVLLTVGFLSTRLARALHCPHSVFLVLLGLVAGVVMHRTGTPVPFSGDFSDLILVVLLPPLIFESAYHLDIAHLRRNLLAVSALSTVGLIISSLVIAFGLSACLDIPLRAALLFGALISATDPVAVVALFREMGAPHRLALLVEGESLCNDGTAIVLYRVLLTLPADVHLSGHTFMAVCGSFVFVTLSGIGVGALFIALASWALRLTESSPSAQIGLTVVTAYGSFLTADHIGASGVMSTLVVGLYLGARARLELNVDALNSMQALWEFIALSANTCVFFAVGLIANLRLLVDAARLLPATLALVYLARILSVLLTVGPLNAARWGTRIPFRWQTVMIWGGLRGGLALALVLLMPATFPDRPVLLAMTGAVVLSTLIINGATMRPLLRLLRLDQLSDAEHVLFRKSLGDVTARVFRTLRDVARRGSLSEELVSQLETRTLQSLEIGGTSMPKEKLEAFDVRWALLEEQEYYDAQLAQGVLSKRAYEALTDTVTRRVDLLEDGGTEALVHFSPEVGTQRHWSLRWLGGETRVQSLSHALETLLQFELAMRRVLSSDDVDPSVRALASAWLHTCEHQLHGLRDASPELEMEVQSRFVADTVAAAGRVTVEELLRASVISPSVHARAVQNLGRLGRDLDDEARQRKPSLRDLMRRDKILSTLPHDAQRLVEHHAPRVRCAAQSPLSNLPAACFHLLCSGLVELRVPGRTPRQMIPGTLLWPADLPYLHAVRDSEVLSVTPGLVDEVSARWPQIRRETFFS